jgi:beta-phosphoglucomutase-like phosphatase (HAD superfamily)
VKRLIIFDCDGTLVDSEVLAAKVFPSVWASVGVHFTEQEFLNHFVGTGADADIVLHTKSRLPPDTGKVAEQAFEVELNRNLKAVHGIPELLLRMQENSGNEQCVASNSAPYYIKNVLGLTGLAQFFGDRIFSAHQVARPKPAPDLFLHAAQYLGYKPEQCLVIEDSPSGVRAAKSAGMNVIGFMGALHFNQILRDRLIAAEADVYCTDISELENKIRTFDQWDLSCGV